MIHDTSREQLSQPFGKHTLGTTQAPIQTVVSLSVDKTAAPSADICLECSGEPVCRCSHAAAPNTVSEKGIQPIRIVLERPKRRWPIALAVIPQLLGWGVGFSGLYAASTVCPHCGQVGCAVGIGTMGIMGGLTATVVSCLRWRRRKRDEEPKPC
jgi:hypothetical protein